MSGVNYFFALATIISPHQRQLLSNSLGGGEAPPSAAFLLCEKENSGRWESGKPAFGFPLFHPPSSPELGECGNLACLLARFPRGSWKEWEAHLAFHAFHRPGISTALSFFRSSCPLKLALFARALAFRLLFVFGVLHSVARDVQFDDHAVMYQPVDRCRRHHGIFEDRFPL